MKNFIKIFKKILISIIIVCSLCVIIRYIIVPKIVFPLKYKKEVYLNANKYDLDPLLIFSIIKAESKFNPNAISRSGAKGLMQIMDTTGEWAASELNLSEFTPDKLFEPAVNIEIGCWYVARLLKQYEGYIPTLLAAYNAGTGNVYKWRNNKDYSVDGVVIDYIPFGETRRYIKTVMKNFKMYNYLY